MTFSPSLSRFENPETHDAMMSLFKRSFNGIIFQATTTMQDYKDCKGSMQARRSQTDVSQLTYCRGHSRVSVEIEFCICINNGLRGDVSCRATRGLVSHSMIIPEI